MDKFLPSNIIKLIKIFLIVVILLIGAKAISEFRSFKFIGEATAPATISFDGKGEVTAVPDIATISFSVRNEAKTAKAAQVVVTEKIAKALDLLKANNIAEKDIKTTNYSTYPKYEYQQASQPCTQNYCPPGRQVLTGYEVSQNIDVKIRVIDDAGKIVEGLATIGVTDMQGPNFAIDKEDDLKAQARTLAIEDAKAKARELARELHVRLVRIVNFSEGGNNPYPMMYAKADMMAVGATPERAPELPVGENKIVSNVTITYEIR
jgi:hypothetical protein